MNFRITTVFILALAMAGCSKPKSGAVAPLTGDEKFQIVNGPQSIERARQAALQTKEAQAFNATVQALKATKEFKALQAAQVAQTKAERDLSFTKESKAAVIAQAAAEQTNESKAVAKVDADRSKAIQAMYGARGLSETDNAICYGPAQFVPTPKLTQIPPDACKGVAENDYEFRAIKK